MILIGDSGSTKTDWRLIENNKVISQFGGKGLNPNFNNSSAIAKEVESLFNKEIAAQVKELHFYGSGCSSEASRDEVKAGFTNHFKQATFFIHHDLLGAARACSGTEPSLVGILGTGSNCCLYDGEHISKSLRSGGYSIGDEGGGVHLGRLILKAYIEEYLPPELVLTFETRYQTNYDEILENLYKMEYPNRYMASFSRFAFHHKQHPFVQNLLVENFQDFFDHKVLRFDKASDYTLNLVGSIAYYFHDIIRAVGEENGIRMGTVIEKPISGLALYHCNLAE